MSTTRTARQRSEEIFSVDFTLESADPEGTFKGYASVFDSLVNAYVPTIIERGAFAKTLRENFKRVKVLYQHDPWQPFGKPTRLEQTARGLYIEGKISATELGEQTLTLMRDGVLVELSIGFDPIKWTMAKGVGPDQQDIRHVSELRLWEVSIVTFAADPSAKITAVAADADRQAIAAKGMQMLDELKVMYAALIRAETAPQLAALDDLEARALGRRR